MSTPSKKLAFSIGVIILSTILLWVGKIPPPVWESLMMVIVGAYLAVQGAVDGVAKYRSQ